MADSVLSLLIIVLSVYIAYERIDLSFFTLQQQQDIYADHNASSGDSRPTKWEFARMATVMSPESAKFMTELDKPFVFSPTHFRSTEDKALELSLLDIKRMFGSENTSRKAEVALGGKINQFQDSFFPISLDDAIPDSVLSERYDGAKGGGLLKKLEANRYEKGNLERGPVPKFEVGDPQKERVYFVYTLNLTEWEGFKEQYMENFPAVLSDDDLLHCFKTRKNLNSFVEKVYWHQLFIGTRGSGMKFHKDAYRTSLWSYQITGEKTFVFCDQDVPMSVIDNIDAFNPTDEMLRNWKTKLRGFGKNDEADYKEPQCFQHTAKAGEYIFWPSTWWHETKILTDYSSNIMGAFLQDHFKHNFDPSPSLLSGASRSLSQATQACLKQWRAGKKPSGR